MPGLGQELRHLRRVSGMNPSLEVLISRVRSPLGTVRWWAMQELSDLLVSAPTSDEVCARLLQELSSCRLEAEALELLCIFWLASGLGYRPPLVLASAVNKPSFASDVLLESMGKVPIRHQSPELHLAQSNFVPHETFERLGQFGVPAIFEKNLQFLEWKTQLPFMRQFSYEWSQTEAAYPDAPLQANFGHFTIPYGNELACTFSNRAITRAITAYHRTLEVASLFWSTPERLMRHYAGFALPLNPTIAALRQRRPIWLPKLGRSATPNASLAERFVRNVLNNFKASNEGDCLLALNLPTHVSENELVELSLVRWRQWSDKPIDAAALCISHEERLYEGAYGQYEDTLWSLGTRIIPSDIDETIDDVFNAAPMAASFGFWRWGYLQAELSPSKFSFPFLPNLPARQEIVPTGGGLGVFNNGVQVAALTYWNAGWSPLHVRESGGNFGTALVGRLEAMELPAAPAASRHFYLWTLRRQSRSNGQGHFSRDEPLSGLVAL